MGSNKQFSFMEISLVYGKSDQRTSMYDGYNCETASTKIDSIKLENANNNYSVSNEIKFDLNNKNDKFLLYWKFSVWYCSGCSIAPLTDYANNEVYRELPSLNKIHTDYDERFFLDLRRGQGYTGELEKISRNNSNLSLTVTFKHDPQKKMRLRVIGYYQSEYLYALSNRGILMSFKQYTIAEQSGIALAA